MANHASALKRHRQNIKRRARNRAIKSRLKTERKKLAAAIEAGDKAAAEAQFKVVQKLMAQAAAKGVLHQNTVSRIISRANAKVLKTAA